ncbi:DASH complex subunit ask1 [Entomophthora muscae]|uniref:DASH complex subunit ask1 n=1 Tax=Entomophthora muscae TaxID=34485 RepID=A0ACC2RLE7_9FUNG|nr:DASH complex subunit ask1 [Entomophthora muscae]
MGDNRSVSRRTTLSQSSMGHYTHVRQAMVEQNITATLQDIDRTFAACHEAITHNILPVADSFITTSRSILSSIRGWQAFFNHLNADPHIDMHTPSEGSPEAEFKAPTPSMAEKAQDKRRLLSEKPILASPSLDTPSFPDLMDEELRLSEPFIASLGIQVLSSPASLETLLFHAQPEHSSQSIPLSSSPLEPYPPPGNAADNTTSSSLTSLSIHQESLELEANLRTSRESSITSLSPVQAPDLPSPLDELSDNDDQFIVSLPEVLARLSCSSCFHEGTIKRIYELLFLHHMGLSLSQLMAQMLEFDPSLISAIINAMLSNNLIIERNNLIILALK